MRRLFLLFSIFFTLPMLAQQYVVTQEHKDRAAEIVSQMTLEEKIAYVGGYENWFVRAVDRLGLPAVKMADGPQGVRNNTRSTLYPSGIAAAATWDVDLIRKMGESLGKDARARGVHILLGPGANIYRSPLCGRNFEYFGEDPFLAGEVAASYINGLQSQGVMACIKHFAGNNSEYARHSSSSDIDERTLHEIYFPAFETAVKKGNVASIMTSYNLLNCVRTSESSYLNQEVLRDFWGFDGFVMSDWNSCYSPLNVAMYGVDLEMPSPRAMEPALMKRLVEQGVIDESAFDRKCQNIIQTILAFEFDKRPQLDSTLPENNPECDAVAHELARAAVVLLKNQDGFLPVKKGKFFVCGPNADKVVTGGGSGQVTPLISSSIADGMLQIGKSVKTTVFGDGSFDHFEDVYTDATFATSGVKVELYTNSKLEGEPEETYLSDKVFLDYTAAEAHEDVVKENISTRHSFVYPAKETRRLIVTVRGNDGCRMFINGEKVVDAWYGESWNNGSVEYVFEEGKNYEFVIEHFNRGGTVGLSMQIKEPLSERLKAAKGLREADCVVVCLGHTADSERENADRTFELPDGHVEYLEEVLKLNDNVVVVLNGGGGVEMASWLPKVKAVLMAWYPGQQGGLAVSEMITGKISPSGRLPISIESVLADNPCSENYHENVNRMRLPRINPYSRVEYREGVFMGYRGYEKNNVEPLFPFGFGLGYTSFDYSNLRVTPSGDGFDVSFTVRNTGKYDGSEVAQIYVGEENPTVPRPVKELKGFKKIFVPKGKTQSVTVHLPKESFAFYDVKTHDWKVNDGIFNIYVGASVADIRLSDKVTLGTDGTYIKVMSYNIRVGRGKDGSNSWQFRRQASISMLREQMPDIFGLQEAVDFQVAYLQDNLPDYSNVGVGRDDGAEKGERMSIFYNTKTVSLDKWGTFWLSETPDVPSKGWDASYPRSATWALMTMKASGRKFFYINTHLDHRGAQAQKNGLDLIVRKIAEINPDNFPMILTGDFNVRPDNPALDELDTKMTSARVSAEDTDQIASFNNWGKSAAVIDYIYYSGFAGCPEYKTIVKQYDEIPYISDHYPIMARLEF